MTARRALIDDYIRYRQ